MASKALLTLLSICLSWHFSLAGRGADETFLKPRQEVMPGITPSLPMDGMAAPGKAAPVKKAGAFCTLPAAPMYSDGLTSTFFSPDARKQSCLIFLVQPLVLDSRLMLGIAMGVALVLGIFVEASNASRRHVVANGWGSCVQVPLYAITGVLGYIAILLVMTYSIELIVSVVLGLAIGHCLFGAAYTSSKEKEYVPVTLPARTGAPANYGAVNSAALLKTPQPKRTQK